jgi:hypothetical protein
VRAWAEAHPNLAAWAVLAVGMLAVLGWSAREVALGPGQWWWLGVATVLLAGLCAWIISWEADAEDAEAGDESGDEGAEEAEAAERGGEEPGA